jgi:F-type H+-transporting ATPase subunit gamma
LQQPSLERVLPLEIPNAPAKTLIIEPSADELIDELARASVFARFRRILAESFTAEHASRVVAMKAATDNANELFEDLTLARNKIRQASITQDIMEIISSSEALKG